MRIFWSILALLLSLALVAHVLFLKQPFFMDEAPIVGNHINFVGKATFLPTDAKYPTFYSYVSFPGTVLAMAGEWLAGADVTLVGAANRLKYLDPLRLVQPARIITLIILAAAAGFTAAINRRFSLWIGGLSGLYLLAAPGLLNYAAYALPDILLMALISLCVLLLVRALDARDWRSARRAFLLASACAGLAVSTKYNGLAVLPAIAVAAGFLVVADGGSKSRRLLTLAASSTLAFALGFFVGSPGWIAAFDFFFAELMFQVDHANHGQIGSLGIPYLGQAELLVTHFPVLSSLGVLGVMAWAYEARSRAGVIALTLVMSGFVLSAQSAKQGVQYLYVVLPGLLFFFGAFWAFVGARFPRVAQGAGLALAAIAVVLSLQSASRYLRPNTTEMTARWLRENVGPDQTIALDWASVPEFRSEEELERIGERVDDPDLVAALRAAQPTTRIERHGADPAYLDGNYADVIVVSSNAYAAFFDHGVFTRLPPPKESIMYFFFETSREFYSRLLESGNWQLVYEADTGNGPRTLVFAPAQGAGATAEED